MDGFIVTSRNADGVKARQRFVYRLGEVFFRRWALYLLPILLLIGIGVLQAKKMTAEYKSIGVLNVASNPQVSGNDVRGLTIYSWETPAIGFARIINELKSTDSFMTDVAKNAGLDNAVTTGALTFDVIRKGISVYANGDTLVAVSAKWADPQTALQLVNATVKTFSDTIVARATEDAQAAIDLYTKSRDTAQVELDTAQKAYDKYVDNDLANVTADKMTAGQQSKLKSLDDDVTSAQTIVRGYQDKIDENQATLTLATSAAGQLVRVTDQAKAPTAPEPLLKKKVMSIGIFTILGLVIAITVLLLVTLADRSVLSASDVGSATGLPVVATVPVVSELRSKRAAAAKSKNKSKARAA